MQLYKCTVFMYICLRVLCSENTAIEQRPRGQAAQSIAEKRFKGTTATAAEVTTAKAAKSSAEQWLMGTTAQGTTATAAKGTKAKAAKETSAKAAKGTTAKAASSCA